MYDETLGKWHFWLSAIFVQPDLLPSALRRPGRHAAPYSGLRHAVCRLQRNLQRWRLRLYGFSQLLLVYIVIKCIRGGEKATAQVWDGAEGLEWTVPSPAPYHTFEEAPIVNK